MSAQIVFDDGGGPSIGTVERDSTFLGQVFTLSNFDDTGVLGWRWTLIDKPLGSAAVLSAQFTPTTQITPDIAGAYFVRLETFLDAPRTIADDADEQLAGIAFPPLLDWQIPAAGETVQRGARGWATPVEYLIRQIRSALGGGQGTRYHIRSGVHLSVAADFQYHLHGALTVDAGGSLTVLPDGQLIVIP